MTDKAVVNRIRRAAKRVGLKLITMQRDCGRVFLISDPSDGDLLMATTDSNQVDVLLRVIALTSARR